MEGEKLTLGDGKRALAVLPIAVDELVQKASTAEPPSNDSSLSAGREAMYEIGGERSMSGELSKEFRQRVTGNVFHVLPE